MYLNNPNFTQKLKKCLSYGRFLYFRLGGPSMAHPSSIHGATRLKTKTCPPAALFFNFCFMQRLKLGMIS